jgi:hypothetical protein
MRKSKTIGCGVLALALLGVVQTVGASIVGHCAGLNKCRNEATNPTQPLVEEPQLAAPVLPTSPKAVTRFSAGAANLRQQVHMQTQHSNGQ